MKTWLQHYFGPGLMLLSALLFAVAPAARAAGETAFLAPATGLTQTNKTFTVSVDGYVGQSWFFWVPVGATSVQGTLNFPAQHLKVSSINTAGSSFPEGMDPTVSAGQITFNGNTGSGSQRNTNVHLFSVTFQAISPGTANISFGSVKYSIGTASTTGGAYTINSPPAPPPAPSPSPKPSPKPSVTPKPATTPKPVVTPTPTPEPTLTTSEEEETVPEENSDGGLKIRDVTVNATRKENSITWNLSDPAAKPVLLYGTIKGQLKNDGVVEQQEDGSFKVIFENLKLGTLYHFTIRAASNNNLQGATYSGILTTRGYPVQLTIQQNDLLLPGAKVAIGERSYVANKSGIVTTELGEGSYTASVIPPGSDEAYEVTFVVAKRTIPSSGNPDLQSFVLNVSDTNSSSGFGGSLTPIIVGGLVALIAVTGAIFGLIAYKRRQSAQGENQTGIDADLLSSTYGDAVNSLGSQTPQPQIGSMALPEESSAMMPESQYSSSINPPVIGSTNDLNPLPEHNDEQIAATYYDASQIEQPAVGDAQINPNGQLIDPMSLPLPPEDNSQGILNTDIVQTPNINETSANQIGMRESESTFETIPEYSQELNQIESSEQITNDEPSAVYDAATGELDIIHHRDNATNIATPLSQSVPEEDPTNMQISHEPTGSQPHDITTSSKPLNQNPVPQQ